jgi:hypothetical protein
MTDLSPDPPSTEPAAREGIRDFALLVTSAVLGVLLVIATIVVVIVLLTVHRDADRATPPAPAFVLDKDSAVFDDFERADSRSLGTPRAGSPWTFIGAEWGIENHEARILNTTNMPTFALNAARSGNGSVQVTIPKMADGAGLIFRFRDLANYWQLVSVPRFATFALSKVVNGTFTTLGNPGLVGTDDGTTVGVLLDGPKITILINEAEVSTFTDPDLEDEHVVGLVGLADRDLRVRFDDFLVSNPPSPGSVAPN